MLRGNGPLVSSTSAGRRSVSTARPPGLVRAIPQVALLVSTYQKPWHLQRVLTSIAAQEGIDGRFEVVVTDDGSTDDTHDLVRRFADCMPFPVAITSHPHVGFQLARCRNQGAAAGRAPYLLFLDGDCVLPPDYVRQHLDRRRPRRVMCGYCYRLDKKTTARFNDRVIRSRQYVDWVPGDERRALAKRRRKARFYQLIHHPTKPRLTGGNLGIWREDFERINGFDENFEGWGGEDTDLGSRLRKTGVRVGSILQWTQSYHLWHPPDVTAPDRIRNGANQNRLQRKGRLTRCRNGLTKRPPADLRVRIAGVPARADLATELFASWRAHAGLPLGGDCRQRAEVEVLFLPGKGGFSGRADCNVLVVLETSKLAKRLAQKAHLVIADESHDQVADQPTFRLNEFNQVMDTLG